MVAFNHIVPRIGATYDLTGDGKTVLKGNWGRFYFNPGVNLADAVNPNTSQPVRGLRTGTTSTAIGSSRKANRSSLQTTLRRRGQRRRSIRT